LADEHWRELLPLLRARDLVAWNQVIDSLFEAVFGSLLIHARRRNTSHGAPVDDPEVQDMTLTLTGEAFVRAMDDIAAFDPALASLPTWIVWKGRSRLKGVLDPLLRQRKEYDTLDAPPRRRDNARAHLQPPPPSIPGAETEAIIAAGHADLKRRVDAILAEMPPQWVDAIVRVWAAREDGVPYPIKAAAESAGLSADAMDSLFRRAARDFKQRWTAAYGNDPDMRSM
jgi:hypothetical protein